MARKSEIGELIRRSRAARTVGWVLGVVGVAALGVGMPASLFVEYQHIGIPATFAGIFAIIISGLCTGNRYGFLDQSFDRFDKSPRGGAA